MRKQLHSLCIPIEGFLRTAIYDFQFGYFYLLDHQSWRSVKRKEYDMEKDGSNFVKDIFITKPQTSILALDNPKFDYPSSITNAIIEVTSTTNFSIFTELLQQVFCYNIQIVIAEKGLNNVYIKNMICIINKSIFKHVELVISFEDFVNAEELLKCAVFPELTFLYVYNSPENTLRYADHEYTSTLFLTTPFSYSTGNYTKSISLFKINSTLYAESLNFNNYYNRKIFIDKNGKIKNGPLTEKDYGNLFINHSWDTLLHNNGFKKLWKVKKDSISICNVCEFRYMCVDARVPKQHSNKNEWYHITECNYNPYIAKWKEEPGYIPLQLSGISVEKEGVVIDENILIEELKKIYAKD